MLSAGPTAQENSVVEQHFAYLDQLVKAGKVYLAGRTTVPDEHAFGIVIFFADSEAEAQRLMEGDPAVAEGVMDAELFPFRIALCQDHRVTGA